MPKIKDSNQLLPWLQLLLIAVAVVLLLWSTPWNNATTDQARVITVSGEATIKAEPDEFVFYPYFEQTGTDQEALKKTLTKQANDAVAALKKLGVEESDMTLDASSYDRWYWEDNEEGMLSVQLTVVVNDKDMAQKVQDYLLSTSAKGQLTPQGVFSKERQRQLDAQAIDEASADARQKAEAQAKLFEASLGKVVRVQQGYDDVFPVEYDTAMPEIAVSSEEASLPILPGKNEYRQTVTVTYELK